MLILLEQIPLGPLAYFPGKLIHTNDITYHPSPMGSPDPTTGDSGQVVEPQSVLLSAKQARERAAKSRAGRSSLQRSCTPH